MINEILHILNTVDGLAGGLIPLGARIAVWGGLCGIVAMLLYLFVSDQQGIAKIKRETRDLRKRIMDLNTEDGEFKKLIRQNLVASFRLLWKVFLPAVVSSIPVIIAFLWLDSFQAYAPPGAGNSVDVVIVPSVADMAFVPSQAFKITPSGVKLTIAKDQPPVEILDSGKLVYKGTPWNPPTRSVYQKSWWNYLLGSEVGYLSPDSGVNTILFGFQRKIVIGYVPSWMATWEFPFFAALFLTALVAKFALKVE
jgi:hypothetical protein